MRIMWLSKRAHGRHMLTGVKPLLRPVHGASHDDLYVRPGDPVGLSAEFCDMLAKDAGVTIQPLGSVRIEVSVRVVD